MGFAGAVAVLAALAGLMTSVRKADMPLPTVPKARMLQEATVPEPLEEEEAEEPPFVPIVGHELLLYRWRRPVASYSVGLVLPSGGRLRHRVSIQGPPWICFYGPFNDYYSRPGFSTTRFEMGFERPRPTVGGMALEEWQALLKMTRPQRQFKSAPPPERGEQAPRGPAAAAFGSRLAPMLGGRPPVGLAFAIGEENLRQGRFGKAIEAFNDAIELRPDAPAPRIALSLALAGVGAYESAAGRLREALDALPDWNVVALEADAVFGIPDRYASVEKRLEQAFAANPSDEDLRLLLWFFYFASWSHTEAAQRPSDARQVPPPEPVGASDPFLRRAHLATERLLRLRPSVSAEVAPATDQSGAGETRGPQQPAGG